ncbi:MAG TPA: TetR/AcrR family transcriptional regulator [Bacteroidales bacterium]|nr:TetR/AcrR family transcriptional regulator [Bacteroidales bacterium]
MEDSTRNTEKIRHITDVAQYLFGLHGFEKVTMNEIAEELKISKAQLYYYFPDKESLCLAVLEKEKNEFLSKISSLLEEMDKPEKMLKDYSIERLKYFRRFLNLGRLRQETYSRLKPVFRESLLKFREMEIVFIKKIIDAAVLSGIFRISDTESVASVYFDLLRGLGASALTQKSTMTLEQDEFDTLLQRTALFTDIFIKGLKAL